GITRVSIDLTRPATFTETIIRNPERLFFDIAAATLSAGLRNKTIEVGDAFLQRVRAGQYRADVARIVLDLNDRTEYAVARLENPSRIVVEIRPKDSAVASADNGAPGGRAPEAKAPAKEPSPKPASASPAAAATGGSNSPAPAIAPLPKPEAVSISPAVAAKTNHKPAMAEAVLPTVKNLDDIALPKPAAPTSRGDRTLARVLGLKVGRIVIDPGHGGHDTGTVGPNGLNEKDLVLELARHLRKLLEENLGAEVVLTRDQDVFISLEERTAIANRYQADLFLSIHANSSRSKGTSGVETYFLDFARTAAEREVAARENAATIHKYSDLEGLVQKIARADKMAESREFAALVQKSLFGTAREVFPSTRNRGVRSAPFIVLIGAKMPSILAEVAFISNPRDEKFLTKDMNRQHLAKALYQGIEGYMKTLGSEVAQTQSSPSIR
ncbi:MAG: N-acetylmuramoyl-L-alanine amidase, partial [Acidobacteria bacterium]|nr:N-acetylmuramoyl-L-alanine amidase [Acidobacteriota bacterium]